MSSVQTSILRLIVFLSVVLLGPVGTAAADQYATVQNGAWSASSTWSDLSGPGGGVPGPSDAATITTNVTLPSATEVGAVMVGGGGLLDLEGNTLTVDGNFVLGANTPATLQSSGSPGAVSVAGGFGVLDATVSDVDLTVASSNGSSPSTAFGADSTWSGSSLTQTGGMSLLDPGEVTGLDPTFDGVDVAVAGTSDLPVVFPVGITLSGTGSLDFGPAGPGATSSPAILQLGSLSASGSQAVNTFWDGYVSGTPADGDLVNLVSAPSASLAGLTATSDSNTTYATSGGVLSATYAGSAPAPPSDTTAPTVSSSNPAAGQAKPGDTLTCASGTWSPSSTYAYAWQRGGSAISGQTGGTYTVTSADLGTTLSCSVTATAGTQSATAKASNSINVPAAPTIALAGPPATVTTTSAWAPYTLGAGDTVTGCTRDGVPLTSCASPISLSGYADASTHTLTVTATNAAGMTTTATAQFVVHLAPSLLAIGSGPGQGSRVEVVDPRTGQTVADFSAFGPSYQGGVSVAFGDLNGDGTPDLIVAGGHGDPPEVKVIDGAKLGELQNGEQVPSSAVLADFYAFDPRFTGGVSVAAGDVEGNGHTDLVVGAGPGGGPQVNVIDGAKLSQLQADGGTPSSASGAATLGSFFAFNPNFTGGVSVAVADVGTTHDLIVGAGPGGGPNVNVYDGPTLSKVASFMAFSPMFTGGVSVAAGDVFDNGTPDVVVGPGAGGGPEVSVFEIANPQTGAAVAPTGVDNFFAYSSSFVGGLNVAASFGGIATAPGQAANAADFWAYNSASNSFSDVDRSSPFPNSSGVSVALSLPGPAPSPTSTSIAAQGTIGSTSTNGASASTKVSCSGSPGTTCHDTLTLQSGGSASQPTTKNAPELAATARKKRGKATPKPIVLGRAKATIPAGTSKTVTISLNRTGRRLLAKRHTLKLRLVITVSGRATTGPTVVFKAKSPKHRH